ncbi:corticoliberin [Sceloporus undulatus]|uniref:corticoliberin n=1 Tax=Sceloporus undulatus TaxID=8520 RepID=UPI001C4DC021|nr:corticoliberin [Sceloporus undulatus]
MRLQLLLWTGLLLGALLPGCPEGRALSQSLPEEESLASRPSEPQEQPPQPWPLFLRLGEEYFLRLGSLRRSPDDDDDAFSSSAASLSSGSSSSSSSSHLAASASGGHFFRAAVQQLLQAQPLRGRGRPSGGAGASSSAWEGEGPEGAGQRLGPTPGKEKRSEEPPISLDLTFHLLREVLEMARAEQLAQQAHSNRKLMEIIGK